MRNSIGSLIVLLWACGCSSSVSVRTYNTGLMDFKDVKTYAWASPTQPKTGNPRVDDNAELNTLVRQDIDDALAKRGFTLDTSGHPGFLVAYRATLDQNVSISADNPNLGYNPYYSRDTNAFRPSNSPENAGQMPGVNSFEQGTLVIDVADPKTRQLVWRVTGADPVNLKNSPDRKKKNLEKAIDKMLKEFPPKTAP